MAKYIYDVDLEAFRRTDKRGKPLYVDIIEANRIINLIELGHSVADITGKVSLSNPKGTVTTINSFIKNYNQGNIEMPTDVPAPVHNFKSLTDTDRINALEERVTELENRLSEIKSDCFMTAFAGESKNESRWKKWLTF